MPENILPLWARAKGFNTWRALYAYGRSNNPYPRGPTKQRRMLCPNCGPIEAEPDIKAGDFVICEECEWSGPARFAFEREWEEVFESGKWRRAAQAGQKEEE